MPSLDDLRRACSEDVLALNPELFAASLPTANSKNKYNARKTVVDGVTFDSGKEALRYRMLTQMQILQEIANLRLQVRYILQDAIVDGNGKEQRAITYTADFVYEQAGKTVIEDCKSPITAKSESFRVRWRMLLAKFKDDPAVICRIYI